MPKIITISREFSSGGRELGKRLADELGIPCYDRQIIDMVAEKQGLDKNYVANMSERDVKVFYNSTIGRGFTSYNFGINQSLQIANAEHTLIRELAEQGDCVIIGRAADVILKEYNPLNLFIYADMESKIARCKARNQEKEDLTDRKIKYMCRDIDKCRANYREMFTDTKWGHRESYHLCINTSGKEIKNLVPALASYVKNWFE